jgi:hypothetical protein
MGVSGGELFPHALVDKLEFGNGEKAFGDASLVTDHNN